MSTSSEEPLIFISYSNRGVEGRLVADISNLLKTALGLEEGQVFAYDRAGQGLAGGSDLTDIHPKVRAARVVLVVASRATARSTWVATELGAALASGRPIFPLAANRWCARFIPTQIQDRAGMPLETVPEICVCIETVAESVGRRAEWNRDLFDKAEQVRQSADSMAEELRRTRVWRTAKRVAIGAFAALSIAILWNQNQQLSDQASLVASLNQGLQNCKTASEAMTKQALNRLVLTVEGSVFVPDSATRGGIQVRACSADRVRNQKCPEDSVVAETNTSGDFLLDFSEPLTSPEIRVVATRDNTLGSGSLKPQLTLPKSLTLSKTN